MGKFSARRAWGALVPTVALVLTTSLPAAADGWVTETFPPQPDVKSSLSTVASADGVTWALGGTQITGKDTQVSQAFRREANGAWQPYAMPNIEKVDDSVAVSSNDAWAVGSDHAEGGTNHAAHWNGTTWTSVPVPAATQGGLAAVDTVGDEVWALGLAVGPDAPTHAVAVRWDGAAWQDAALPPALNTVGAIDGSSPNDVWAVGAGGSAHYPEYGVAQHWDGTTWTETPLPATDGLYLDDVLSVSANDVWAVGHHWTSTGEVPATLHWDGASWTEVPVAAQTRKLTELAVVDGAVWTLGVSNEGTLLLAWQDGAWQPVGAPEGPYLLDVTAQRGGAVLVGTSTDDTGKAQPFAATGP